MTVRPRVACNAGRGAATATSGSNPRRHGTSTVNEIAGGMNGRIVRRQGRVDGAGETPSLKTPVLGLDHRAGVRASVERVSVIAMTDGAGPAGPGGTTRCFNGAAFRYVMMKS